MMVSSLLDIKLRRCLASLLVRFHAALAACLPPSLSAKRELQETRSSFNDKDR